MSPKTVLITGCSAGGIGSALARSFHSHEIHVFATTRTTSKMFHLQTLPNMTLLSLDVTSSADIKAAVQVVEAKTGGTLDYLVNNSGSILFMPILDTNIDEAKKMYDINFRGALAVIQAFAPLLIAAKGTLINICSITSHLNVPWMGLYASSKSALEIISETARLELQPLGVRVVSVVTSIVESRLQLNQPELKLPSQSQYRAIEGIIAARGRGDDGVVRMETAEYAERVVEDVLAGKSGRIWWGTDAEVVGRGKGAMPDDVMIQGTGLKSFNPDD